MCRMENFRGMFSKTLLMKLTIYRIFSFLLLPMAILFTICVLLFLRAAFANPAMFFPLFLFACIAIYSFASLNFLIKGVDGKRSLNRSSKDWIKVITQCILFLLHPEMLQELIVQAKRNAGDAFKMSDTEFENYIRITSYFFLVYAIVLLVHIMMSFQYIKMYNYLFQNEKQ